jgi:hypothetical protein
VFLFLILAIFEVLRVVLARRVGLGGAAWTFSCSFFCRAGTPEILWLQC